jgi:hypothetical protein
MLEIETMQDTGKFRDTKDQYYTKRNIAEACVKDVVDSLPWTSSASSALWIEPSAGAGSFLGLCNSEVIPIDLEPKAEGIIRGDFLKWSAPEDSRSRVFFGNPPFGRQGSLAKKFIAHACAQGARAIAFILPRSFLKPSMYSCFPEEFHLVKQVELPKNSFEVNKKDYDVPCVFQIWEKRPNMKRELEEKESPVGFKYVQPGQPYDLAFRRVGGLAGTCYTPEVSNPSPQSHHFLKFDRPNSEIQKRINSHIFPSNTTGPRSLSKPEINKVINLIIADLAP